MAKNRARRRKSYKNKDVTTLIKIVDRLHKKQDKLLQKIEDLEEYANFLEINNAVDDDDLSAGTFLEFEADDAFEEILQDQLTDTQKDKIEEIKKDKNKNKKKKKEKKPKLYSIDEILDTLDEKKDK
jgi:cell fate (sporulation/competence/biofilm development) regulator YlbF (YheA/YmcA/DUF963 family)